ncbi:MAG: aquaporin Z [Dehalococcoidia bacterium]
MQRKVAAEVVGTFVLVLGGCGAAVIAGGAIGAQGVAIAFGLTVLVMAFAVGPISGAHFNPAVTIGLVVGKRFESKDAPYYIVAQVAGAILAGAVLYIIASGLDGFDASNGFAANGYDKHSPEGYSLMAGLVCEIVMTAIFLVVIMGATSKKASTSFAPIAIGLALTLIHLVSIPVTNTSVNPARSTGVALFVGEGWAIGQLWLFWVAPIIGGAVGALVWRYLLEDPGESAIPAAGGAELQPAGAGGGQ